MNRVPRTKLLLAGTLAVIGLAVLQWYNIYYLNDGFSLRSICSDRLARPEWKLAPLTGRQRADFQHILEQPFHYLNQGEHSYAFVSEDGHYVLKFFKQKRLQEPLWATSLPLPGKLATWQLQACERCRQRTHRLFSSYKAAYEQLQQETGIIYLQLNPRPGTDLLTTLVDKRGTPHQFDLSETEFLLQHRGALVHGYVNSAASHGNMAAARKALDSVLHLLDRRTRKGFVDDDPAFIQNYGLNGDIAIQFDAASLRYVPEARTAAGYARELVKATAQLRQWLEESYPALARHIDHKLWRLISLREAEGDS